MIPIRQRARKRNCKSRGGTATVEFAFCAPVFFLITFIGIEIARVNMVIQTTESACVQAARRGIVPGATRADVEAAAESILDSAKIINYSVAVTPNVIENDTAEVSVTIDVPMAGNGYVTPGFFGAKTASHSVTFKREN